jgi:TolB-like protein/DNA-binding winged helix-turn-helix (wHTH) protein
MASSVKSVVIIFGPYEFSPYSGELRKEGMRVRLEGQPLTILQVLLDRPGELVSRDELLKKLWPGDTFVDFEHSLNAAVKRLRAALNDPAEQPHYIETLARRGYRFIAPVKMADDQIGIAAFAVTPALGVAHPPLAVGGRRWSLIAVVVCVVAIVAWGWRQWWHRTATPAVPAIRSLAVLPLENLSGDPSQEYFADGMTEELIGRLSNLHGLRVISRTSAMQFKHTQLSLPEIARTLRVDAIVEGSVMREGARIRVHAQLIRGATDEHFWSKTYDRELGNALQVEGEVSQAIADEVGIKITPQEQNRLQRKPTPNPEAREAYLRARYFLERDDKEGATKCLQYFREAIAKDPSYAAAYAGLSRCYGLAYSFDMFSWSEAISKRGKAAALKAAELDDGLAEGHSELADYYFDDEWNFDAAEREYKRALEINPNSSDVLRNHSFFVQRIGRQDEAVKEVYRARELDPLSLSMADDVAWTLMYARRYDEAVNQFHNVLEMDPNFRRARWGLARVYELKGMYRKAISECLKIPALPNIDPFAKALFGRRCSLYEKAYKISGAEHINRKWFESARREIKDAIDRDDDAYSIAALYAETRENEKAIDLLERAYAQHDAALLQLKVDPRMDNLRSGPRFNALLHRINFPD